MNSIFRSELDIKSMISILREKITSIEWRMGDSENRYYGFYVLGHTRNGIIIKIIEEDEPGKFYLGIYFYATNHNFGSVRRLIVVSVLRHRIMRSIAARKCFR
jgi:hypothetical protein